MTGTIISKAFGMVAVSASVSVFAASAGVHAQQADPARSISTAQAGKASLDFTAQTRLRGLVMPLHHATISSRLAATIEKIGPNNGERFQKGDVLVKFDCAVFEAELARAKAQAEAAADAYRVKQTLARSGSVSRLQAVLARSEEKRAKAEVRVAEEKVSQCVVEAPFSGRVVRRIANAYETANFRDPLIEIVSDQDVEIRVFVPSHWLPNLKPGRTFKFLVDETSVEVTAKIIAVGAWIDNVSQLLEVRARVADTKVELVAGMSGQAEFRNLK